MPTQRNLVTAIFVDADAFVRALDALLKAGFDRTAISILADHDTVKVHFGEIPAAEAMADRADTPREDLDTEGALRTAIRFLAESVAVIGEIGAAGIAYAVGGPVGIASTTAEAGERGVGSLLTRYVEAESRARFEESVRDGGVICWVDATSAADVTRASGILAAQGGANVHVVKPSA